MKQKLTQLMLLLMLTIGTQQAHAQFGSLVNNAKIATKKAIKQESKSLTKEATKAVRNAGAKTTEYTYGDHVYTMKGTFSIARYDSNAAGTVTFTHVPSDYEEFETVYNEFLGTTPHGTAAMMPMAMEIYARNPEEGLRCIKLINWPTNVNSVVSQLQSKLKAVQAGDSYGQRYLPAAVLKGATPANGYTPIRPYTVTMNASVNKHQDLQITGNGRVMYLYIMGKGWDTEQRSVEIVKSPDSGTFQVFNCPALYTDCKQIQGTWGGLD